MLRSPISLASSLEGIKLNLFASMRRQTTETSILKLSFSSTIRFSLLPRHSSLFLSWTIFNDRLYSASLLQTGANVCIRSSRGENVVSCLVTANRIYFQWEGCQSVGPRHIHGNMAHLNLDYTFNKIFS